MSLSIRCSVQAGQEAFSAKWIGFAYLDDSKTGASFFLALEHAGTPADAVERAERAGRLLLEKALGVWPESATEDEVVR